MVWYSHLFRNFPQFIVIHTVKSFGVVNKAEVDMPYNEYLKIDLPKFMVKNRNTGVGILSFLQWVFPTQESNEGLPHCRWNLYQLSYQ